MLDMLRDITGSPEAASHWRLRDADHTATSAFIEREVCSPNAQSGTLSSKKQRCISQATWGLSTSRQAHWLCHSRLLGTNVVDM